MTPQAMEEFFNLWDDPAAEKRKNKMLCRCFEHSVLMDHILQGLVRFRNFSFLNRLDCFQIRGNLANFPPFIFNEHTQIPAKQLADAGVAVPNGTVPK